MIPRFRGRYFFLSNFYYHDVFDYHSFQRKFTLEHYFQSEKATNDKDRNYVLAANSPREAKKRGREITKRDGWDDIRVSVMLRLLLQKFEDPELRRRLISTHPKYLQEGNTWGDTFWGHDLSTGKGRNMLGKLLMLVRDIHLTQSHLDFGFDQLH